jgi:hypothetical protein
VTPPGHAADPNLQPCPSCSHVFAVYRPQCPACGKPRRHTSANPTAAPRDWVVETSSDGTVRLNRSGAYRLRSGLILVALASLGVPTLITHGPFSRSRDFSASGLEWFLYSSALGIGAAVMVALTVLVLAWLLFGALGTEEWRAEPDRLTLRRALFRWNQHRSYSGAKLAIASRWHYDRWQRPEYQVTHLELWTDGGTVTVARERGGIGALSEMGRCLSEATGWALLHEDPRV